VRSSIARTLEDGKIQMAFFDDRPALLDLYTGDHAEAVAAGVRAVKMDPSTILMTMGMVTQRLGLGVTYSPPPITSRSMSRACSRRCA
jgi:alkanesulfonate monooxygenase SsuD/methylene tetrahydromethanopterin reductase-like flavin-dependent oxidoreductase (luciferase family)